MSNADNAAITVIVTQTPISWRMLGKVIEVGETFVTLEVAEGVRIKVQRFQIAQLMPKGTLKSA